MSGPGPGAAGAALRRFARAYGEHRAAEGRGGGGPEELGALPWLRDGPLARSWAVRARTFERFLADVVLPRAASVGAGRLHVLDAGAGNGWLSYRLAERGYPALAVDVRTDGIDGLGAGRGYAAFLGAPLPRVAASFEALPLASGSFDIVVFNASLHYAVDLAGALAEARRVLRPDGAVAILDSPFYRSGADGEAMVREKRAGAGVRFGARADDLTALDFAEYLTADRLRSASATAGLTWTRHRVRYPLWYELRAVRARLSGRRRPSRFDLWVGRTERAVP